MSKRSEPETRKVRVVAVEPPRTTVLPDELLRELRRGAAPEPRTPRPAEREPSGRTLPVTTVLRAPRKSRPGAPPRTRLVLAAAVAALLCVALLALAPREPRASGSAARKTARAETRPAAQQAVRTHDPEQPGEQSTASAGAGPVPADRAPVAARVARARSAPRDGRALAQLTDTAIDQLARGDDAAALASYRTLAALLPAERAYALVAEVLQDRLDARCRDATVNGGPCPR